LFAEQAVVKASDKGSIRLKVAASEMKGKRNTMEDATIMFGCFRGKEDEDLFAIFDGHGGKDSADYAAKIIPEHLKSNLEQDLPQKALADSFNAVHKEMSAWAVYSGTTCCSALFIKNILYVANVGDTRAVLCRKGKAIRLSFDHTIKVPEEVKRIEELGGSITNDRVQGLLSVTRAMGDSMLHPYVIADPYICTHELSIMDSFLIIACDGIWDVFTDDQAVQMAREILEDVNAPTLDEMGNPRKELVQIAADKLRDTAYDRGSTDNISVLIIDIRNMFNKQDGNK